MIPRVFVDSILLIYGALLPLHGSLKALKSEKEMDISKWLLHWISFAMFLVCLSLTDIIFRFWLPLYNDIVLIIFFWLISSKLSGEECLYQWYLKPIFSEYEETIDEIIETLPSRILNTAFALSSIAMDFVVEFAAENLKDSNAQTLICLRSLLNLKKEYCLRAKKQVKSQLKINPEEDSCLGAKKQMEIQPNINPEEDRCLRRKKQVESQPKIYPEEDRCLGAKKQIEIQPNINPEEDRCLRRKKQVESQPKINPEEDCCTEAKKQVDSKPNIDPEEHCLETRIKLERKN